MTSRPGERVVLRPATERDLADMARVHRAAYGPGHFLALLPASALTAYYRLFLGGGSQALVAETKGDGSGQDAFAGFAVFGANMEPRIGQFKREQRRTILQTAILNPRFSARKVMLGFLGSGGADTPHEPADWLLLSIAVDGARRGVGSALLQEMLRVATEHGQRRFGLYVRHSNFGAVNAYLRAGFRIVASIADQYYMETALTPSPASDTR